MRKKTKTVFAAILILIVAAAAGFVAASFASYEKSAAQYPAVDSSLNNLLGELKQANDAHINGTLDSMSYIRLVNEKKPAIQKIITSLGAPVSSKAADRERRRLLRRAYLVMNFALSGYHCARAVLYSPTGPSDNMCFPYNAKDLEKDFESAGAMTEASKNAAYSPVDVAMAQAGSFLELAKKADGRSSIILIVIDTLRADMAYDPDNAPFINRLAAKGLVFRDAMAAGSATNISTASILTGAPPYAHGLLDFGQWNSGLMFVPLLQDAGYETAGFSANSIVVDTMGFSAGFNYFNDRFWMPAELMNNEIYSYIDAVREGSAPLFMYMHFIDPHGPYFSPDDFNETTGLISKRPESVEPDRIRKQFNQKGLDARDYVDGDTVADMKQYYQREIAYSDRMLELLFAKLDEAGILRGSLVVITADHGEEFLEHGGVKHSKTLYDELVHVPLIVWGKIPEQWRKSHSPDRPVSLIDIAPTILEYAGIKRPRHMTGTHLFMGPPAKRRYAVAAGVVPGTINSSCVIEAVASSDYKMVLCPENQAYQLFDVRQDPKNISPLGGEIGAVSETLINELADWRKTTTPVNPPSKGGPPPEVKKQLKSLGYIE